MMKIRLTQLDGKLPNLALMKLAHWHRSQNHQVFLARTPSPSMFEPTYDLVYGSAIFEWTRPVVDRLLAAYPEAQVGGTGTGKWRTVESITGEGYEFYDYSIYPEYPHSLGFTQRGCRYGCKFCVVPQKEGKPVAVNTIRDIWRPGTRKAVLLLDNDFFGVPEWKDRIQELREGRFRVSFNQGVNVRAITDETAAALASVQYRDDDFRRRRLYTAWDNLGDEGRFFQGLARLNTAGIPSSHLMVYMLVGFARDETMDAVLHRFSRLVDAGCLPYPMVYEKWRQPELRRFARWAIRRYYEFVPWEEFGKGRSRRPSAPAQTTTLIQDSI